MVRNAHEVALEPGGPRRARAAARRGGAAVDNGQREFVPSLPQRLHRAGVLQPKDDLAAPQCAPRGVVASVHARGGA